MVLCVMVAACGGSRGAEEQLDRADAWMDTHPDSALYELNSIDTSRLDETEAARRALLLSQAYDKMKKDITDDSLIAVAREYYLTHPGRRDLLARAYYYSGVVAYNAGDYPGGIYYLSLADTLAAGLADYRLCGMANALLAWSNSALLDLENEYRHAERSLRFFTLAGDSARASDQMLNVAICHLQLDRPAEALAVLDSPGCAPGPVTRASSLVKLGRLREFRAMMELDSALGNSSKLMSQYAQQLVDSGRLTEADSALARAFRTAKNSYDTASCMGVKAELLKSRGQWQQYASIAHQMFLELNADYKLAVHNAEVGSRAEALHFLATNEKKELELRNITLRLWGVSGTLLAGVMIYLLVIFIKKKRKSDRQFVQQIENQQRDILSASKHRAHLEQKITEQEASSAILIEKCDKLSQTNEAFVNASRKYDSETLKGTVANLKDELRSLCEKYIGLANDNKEVRRTCLEEIMSVYTPGCKDLFECYVDNIYSNIIAKAREAGFTDDDIEMAILDKLGFSNMEIMVLLGIVSPGAATTRKSRIKSRLKKLPA